MKTMIASIVMAALVISGTAYAADPVKADVKGDIKAETPVIQQDASKLKDVKKDEVTKDQSKKDESKKEDAKKEDVKKDGKEKSDASKSSTVTGTTTGTLVSP